ncbi:MAG: hypothetical protein CVU90_04625 [Firmicutes bacterium HGW-Firmicutes-15]|nr:MAG: hypothetical protein CVU90_04625 [Firmicutes bacterium HGW-Firmicutes-15]
MLFKTKTNYIQIYLLLMILISLSFLVGPLLASASADTGVSHPLVILNGRQLEFEVLPTIENNRTMVPLRTIFESMGAKVDWNSTTLVVTATKGDITVILPLNSRTATVNGSIYNLEVPSKIVNNRTLAPLRFVAEAFGGTVTWDENTGNINIISSDPTPSPPVPQPREVIVVLDAGHGGWDPGAGVSQLIEKDVNLVIALKAGELLKQRGIRVEYTRNNDSYVSLEERSSIANKLNATLFVSIHNNANILSAPCGTETYFYAPQEYPDLFVQRDDRARLAKALQIQLLDKLQRQNRGVKEANLSVLRNTRMPSVLVEVAFISNPAEEALLKTNDFKDRAAQAIANGILSFLNK